MQVIESIGSRISKLEKTYRSLGVKTGLSGLFQQAYRYLYKGLEEKSYAPIRDAFEEWVAEFWKGGVARRNRRLASALLERVAWIPGKVAADRLGITTKRLKYLVQEGSPLCPSPMKTTFLLLMHFASGI